MLTLILLVHVYVDVDVNVGIAASSEQLCMPEQLSSSAESRECKSKRGDQKYRERERRF